MGLLRRNDFGVTNLHVGRSSPTPTRPLWAARQPKGPRQKIKPPSKRQKNNGGTAKQTHGRIANPPTVRSPIPAQRPKGNGCSHQEWKIHNHSPCVESWLFCEIIFAGLWRWWGSRASEKANRDWAMMGGTANYGTSRAFRSVGRSFAWDDGQRELSRNALTPTACLCVWGKRVRGRLRDGERVPFGSQGCTLSLHGRCPVSTTRSARTL